MKEAPKINDKQVLNYYLTADDLICVEAQVADDFLIAESKVLSRYYQSLSSEKSKSIVATPEDMRTPCLLIDQVYNDGGLYAKGFPIQEWHKNGLQRIMTSYEMNKPLSGKLFELPEKYKRYSLGDNLSFDSPVMENSVDQKPVVPNAEGF